MFVTYLKLTNFCNVGCDFCYLPLDTRADKTRMSEETLIASIKQAEAAAIAEKYNSVLYVIHGGEPLTLSGDVLNEYCELIEKTATIPFVLTLQTSLIPLRESHYPVISKWFKGFIGSSIDFSGRTLKGSVDKYIELWLEKAHLATNAGFEVVPSFVPSTDDIGREEEIVNWFVDHGFNRFNTERYNLGTNNSTRPTNSQHSKFLTELSKAILKKASNGVYLANNVLEAAIHGVTSGIPGDRWGGSCIRSFYVVNPNGEVHFCPDLIERREAFGNVADDPVIIFKSKERTESLTSYITDHKNMYCSTCEFRSWCKSGCPITSNDVSGEGECSGYKNYLLWVKKKDTRALEEYITGISLTYPGDVGGYAYG